MPVDRVRRDAAAGILASFLRGEIDRDTLGAELRRLAQADESEEKSRSGKDTYLEELLPLWLHVVLTHRPISEEMWVALCRHLAFLKTDYEERRWRDCVHEDEDRPRQILLARWHALGLLVAFGLAYLTSWWIAVAATLISFLLYQAAMWKHDSLVNEERRRQLKQRWEFYPFADQNEWLAHRHIVDQYHLPAYDMDAFDIPPQTRKWPSILAAPVRWTCYLLVAAMFLYMYLFSVALWPVWLVMMSLCRRDIDRQEQVKS
jgi:hypothetical protein